MTDIVERLRELSDVTAGLTDQAADEIERLRLALEEIIQSADVELAAAADLNETVDLHVISSHLIERARAALDEPHEFHQSVPPAIG